MSKMSKKSKMLIDVFLFPMFSYAVDRESPARDYPKPWLDFLYEQGCVTYHIHKSSHIAFLIILLKLTNHSLVFAFNLKILLFLATIHGVNHNIIYLHHSMKEFCD